MELDFVSNKLRRQMESPAELQKAFGQLSRPIQMRLGILKNATSLADVPRTPPERCHLLFGHLEGHFAVVLKDNWRLIFRPNHDPVPKKEDRGIDLERVTAIMIEGVEDYHGK
ncbi:system killer suppression protein [Rhizobium pisi]|uniref:system killer suppression protein n=1 Tax=Rhizobium pisi TaxID=574561 RepID=UPI0039B1011B